jgi:hypothetical protein
VRPSGPSLKLLALARTKGIDAILWDLSSSRLAARASRMRGDDLANVPPLFTPLWRCELSRLEERKSAAGDAVSRLRRYHWQGSAGCGSMPP